MLLQNDDVRNTNPYNVNKMQIEVLLQKVQVFLIVKQYLMSSAYKIQVMPVKEFADNIAAECEWHAPIVLSPSLHLLVRIRP